MKVTPETRKHIAKHLLNVDLCKWLSPDAFDSHLIAAPIDRTKRMTHLNFMLIEKRNARKTPTWAATTCARLVSQKLAATT